MPKAPPHLHYSHAGPTPYSSAYAGHVEGSPVSMMSNDSQPALSPAGSPSATAPARSVVSAACLSCRAAKRRCDGEKPVCTQCAQRGVTADMSPEAGGCQYVASKRGGPRYKGVRGAAALAKTEQRRLEKEAMAAAKASGQTLTTVHASAASRTGADYANKHTSSSKAIGRQGRTSASGPADAYSTAGGPGAQADLAGYPGMPGWGEEQIRQGESTLVAPTVPSSSSSQLRSHPAISHFHALGGSMPQRGGHLDPAAGQASHLMPPASTGMVGGSGASQAMPGSSQGSESISPALSLMHMSGSGQESSGRGSPTNSSDGSLAVTGHSTFHGHGQHGWRGAPYMPNRAQQVQVSSSPLAVRTELPRNASFSGHSSKVGFVQSSSSLAPGFSTSTIGSINTRPGGLKAGGMQPPAWASATHGTGQVANAMEGGPHALGMMPHLQANIPVPDAYAESVALVGDLSFANLEMWSKLQNYQLPPATARPPVQEGMAIDTTVQALQMARAAISPVSSYPAPWQSSTRTQHSSNTSGAEVSASTQMNGNNSQFSSATFVFADFIHKLEALPKAGVVGVSDDDEDVDDSSGHGSGARADKASLGRADDFSEGSDGRGRLRSTFDTERRVKALLADYFQLVYPASPVMLPPTHLSSLTFHFCEEGPSPLLSAISASVAQHLSDVEAQKTMQEDAAVSLAQSLGKSSVRELTRLEVAAHHAATAEMLFAGKDDQLVAAGASSLSSSSGPSTPDLSVRTVGTSSVAGANASGTSFVSTTTTSATLGANVPSSNLGGGGASTSHASTSRPFRSSRVDRQLILIECVAARVLLAQYYYGQCGHRGHKRAYLGALRAWEQAQSLVLFPPSTDEAQASATGTDAIGGGAGGGGGGFSQAEKVEWSRRVYHACFSAVVVLATTGGFEPVQAAQDVLTALQCRPSLSSDDAAWGTLIRGSHYVCNTYQALYDLESFRRGEGNFAVHSQAQAYAVRHGIFLRMSTLDVDMANYCSYDPEWAASARAARSSPRAAAAAELEAGSVTPPTAHSTSTVDEPMAAAAHGPVTASTFAVEVENELARSLKVAGKLMTAGSMIILHRAQAFGNAKLFMDAPHCGLPAFNVLEASRRASAEASSSTLAMSVSHDASLDEDALWHRSDHREASPTESAATSSFYGSSLAPHLGGGGGSGSGGGATASSSATTHSTALSSLHSSSVDSVVSGKMSVPSAAAPTASTSMSDEGRHGSDPRTPPAGAAPVPSPSVPTSTTTTMVGGSQGGPVPAKVFFPADDRYMGGPFDAKLSLQRCKLAAAVMHETFIKLEQVKGRELATCTREQRRRLSLRPVASPAGGAGGGRLDGDAGMATISSSSSPSSSTWLGAEATPRLPPYSACSYVLSAYVWLMLSLLALLGTEDRAEAAAQIGLLRSRARSIHAMLGRMAASWRNAGEYRAEVETLLLANERLAG